MFPLFVIVLWERNEIEVGLAQLFKEEYENIWKNNA